jgi:hypothetical protein
MHAAILVALRLNRDRSERQRGGDRRKGGRRDGDADHAVKCGITLASGSPVRPVLSTRLRPPAIFICLDHDCHIASATAATVHAAVQATASASQIAAALRRGGSGLSSAGVGSSGRTSPGGGCTCFISRSPRVGNTRRRRFTQSRARNHADLSRAGHIASCQAWGHKADVNVEVPGTGRRLRCSQCGGKRIDTRPAWHTM